MRIKSLDIGKSLVEKKKSFILSLSVWCVERIFLEIIKNIYNFYDLFERIYRKKLCPSEDNLKIYFSEMK